MVADGTYTAVLDRFEETQAGDELAVLLLESNGGVVDDVAVERERVPDPGQHPDAVFEVTVVDGRVQTLTVRPDETEERRRTAQSRFDRLSRRPPEDERPDE